MRSIGRTAVRVSQRCGRTRATMCRRWLMRRITSRRFVRCLGVSMRTCTTEESHTAADTCCTALRCCARPYVIPRCFDAHAYHRGITYGRAQHLRAPKTSSPPPTSRALCTLTNRSLVWMLLQRRRGRRLPPGRPASLTLTPPSLLSGRADSSGASVLWRRAHAVAARRGGRAAGRYRRAAKGGAGPEPVVRGGVHRG
eukprot:SAG11_NODE_3408_length_2465_cov_3.113694_2_plen_198_part_00